jgi:regulatory factor X
MAPEDPAALILPDITPYLPHRTDPDAAQALFALYRTHCTSLIDSVRFCKEKQFFRLFSSFHGTLTVPVQKLFAQREVTPWIRECDWIMYQKEPVPAHLASRASSGFEISGQRREKPSAPPVQSL